MTSYSDSQLLEAVEEALVGRLSKPYAEMSFGGQRIALMDPAALLKLRDELKARVEDTTSAGRTFVRFRDD